MSIKALLEVFDRLLMVLTLSCSWAYHLRSRPLVPDALPHQCQLKTPDQKKTVVNATQYGPACFQPSSTLITSEDCLTINIIRPAQASSKDNLPVLQWIYGGAFTTGATALYNGTRLVAASVQAGKPIIWVSANYRVGPWGFMAGTEFTAASHKDNSKTALNAGLHDQRTALKWTQKNIHALGGDPGKVTIWGQSAGAISVGIQLIANSGDSQNLFHAAFMQSGSPGYGGILPSTHPRLDNTWDTLTGKVGCNVNTSSSTSRLECLRTVNATILNNAAAEIISNATIAPPAGNIVWSPQIDGYFISERPSRIYAKGKVADVPIISGDANDEGTILVSSKTVPDEASFKEYARGFLVISNNSHSEKVLDRLFALYPNDATLGSPYTQKGTKGSQATANASDPLGTPATNQFKRLASLFGDYAFQSQRRYFLSSLAGLGEEKKHKSPIWSYIDRQIDIGTNQTRGAFHGSDIVYYLGNTIQRNSTTLVPSLHRLMQSSLISFVNHHNPTRLADIKWPQYGKKGYLKQWQADNITIVRDDYRSQALGYWFKENPARVLNF